MKLLSTIRNLTGGRLSPLTQTALLTAFAVFVLALFLFAPGATHRPLAQQLPIKVKLIEINDTGAESVILLDTSAVYIPQRSKIGSIGQGRIGQPEEAPFIQPLPVLQFDSDMPPTKNAALQSHFQSVPNPINAVPLSKSEPFSTFGMKSLKTTKFDVRAAYYEIYPLNGANLPIISGIIPHLESNFKEGAENSQTNSLFNLTFEAIISVDTFGNGPIGGVLSQTGNLELDSAIIRWAANIPWNKKLPLGLYLLIVGP